MPVGNVSVVGRQRARYGPVPAFAPANNAAISAICHLTSAKTVRAELPVYLAEEIFPQLAPPPYAAIEVAALSEHKPVFLFREIPHGVEVVGKLFVQDGVTSEEAWKAAEKEYFNLRLLENRYDMGNGVCRVASPLGRNRELGALLVTRKAPGTLLDHYIREAAWAKASEELLDKLSLLARFFARLHENSRGKRPVSPALMHSYLRSLTDALSEDILPAWERSEVEYYRQAWADRIGSSGRDGEVIVHGDATPTNFLFTDHGVTGIDLERMKWADRCWDLGFMAAELKHHFMWRSGDGWAAERFIGHFLREYAAGCGGRRMFEETTRRLPVYMALGLLRIARNRWLGGPYRRDLVREAKQCLQYGL